MFVRWNLTVFSVIHCSRLMAFVLSPRAIASRIVSSFCVQIAPRGLGGGR